MTEREQIATAFAEILGDLLTRVPGTLGACLVDADGEAVDYAGQLSAFDIKVAAAHTRIVLFLLGRFEPVGAVRSLAIVGATRTVVARAIDDGYALVALVEGPAASAPDSRAFAACAYALAREAGLTPTTGGWCAVQVACDANRRPLAIAYRGDMEPLEILGTVRDLSRRERGYRVRMTAGSELTLVREASGFWYAEERLSAM